LAQLQPQLVSKQYPTHVILPKTLLSHIYLVRKCPISYIKQIAKKYRDNHLMHIHYLREVLQIKLMKYEMDTPPLVPHHARSKKFRFSLL